MYLNFSTKTYVVGSQKNRLNEHPKQMFKLMDKKILTAILHLKSFAIGLMELYGLSLVRVEPPYRTITNCTEIQCKRLRQT